MKVAETNFSKIKKNYLNFLKKQEILGEPFHDKLGQLKNYYIPICDSINKEYKSKKKNFNNRVVRRARIWKNHYCRDNKNYFKK